jgi:glycosyltransferase involved in cell wall biosynthesis
VDRIVYQLNLQTSLGGGEVYAAFLCRALSRLGWATRLFVHPRAAFWRDLDLPGDTVLAPVADASAAAAQLPTGPLWLLGHGPLPAALRTAAPGRLRTAIAHMPVQGRNPRHFENHDLVFAVSGWVRDGLIAAGLPAWREPLYGVADLTRRAGSGEIRRTSRYDWDRRKLRDWVLGWLEPVAEAVRPHPAYTRRRGLTLGIVSRLTPIKQFPLLFSLLAPVLARFPDVNLEVFGSGGYASVRDLDRALAPIAGRVRFWGQQRDVAAVYRGVDFLMAGLPEKEALGLNVIEAQACGTPVLAVAAPPFTETVLDGRTGFLYRDPREDGAASFAALIERLRTSPQTLQPREATAHLARFGFDAFVERLRGVVAWAQDGLQR